MLRFLSLLLFLVSSVAFADAPLVWNGLYAKFLTSSGWALSGGKQYVDLAVDPSAGGGLASPIGSMGVRNNAGVGELWLKTAAANTAWTNLSGTSAVPTSRTISTTAPLTGGGDLTANRTFSIAAATDAVNGYLTAVDHTTYTGYATTLAGKVTGPASATDTAIARYNGTTGKLIQDSLATIDASGNITAPKFISNSGGTGAAPSLSVPTGGGNNAGMYFGAGGATLTYNGADIASWIGSIWKFGVPLQMFITTNATNPGMYWINDSTTGFYRSAANQWGWSSSGVQVLNLSSTGADVTGAFSSSGTSTVGQLIDSGLTASTVPYANASKQLTSSAVTPTELSYVSGVTSAIQTQLNGKQASGTYVTAITVASANGLTGSSSGGATPALTIGTSITGVLKGNGTAISAATAGTDYSAGTSALATGILKSTTATGALTIAASGTDYQAPISTSSAVANQFVTGFTAPNTFSRAQPAFTDISGSVAAAQLPNPSSSTLGGVQSIAAGTNKLVSAISTSGVPSQKTLTAGTNMTLTDNGTTITLDAAGGGGGTGKFWTGYHDTDCGGGSWSQAPGSIADFGDDASCTFVTQVQNGFSGAVVTYGASKPGLAITAPNTGNIETCVSGDAMNGATNNIIQFDLYDGTSSTLTEGNGNNVYEPFRLCVTTAVTASSVYNVRIRGWAPSTGTIGLNLGSRGRLTWSVRYL